MELYEKFETVCRPQYSKNVCFEKLEEIKFKHLESAAKVKDMMNAIGRSRGKISSARVAAEGGPFSAAIDYVQELRIVIRDSQRLAFQCKQVLREGIASDDCLNLMEFPFTPSQEEMFYERCTIESIHTAITDYKLMLVQDERSAGRAFREAPILYQKIRLKIIDIGEELFRLNDFLSKVLKDHREPAGGV